MDDRYSYTPATNPPARETIADATATRPLTDPTPTATTTYPRTTTEPVVGRTVTERRVEPIRSRDTEPPVNERRFSIGATFLGWACASFFTLVFLALVAGFLGGNAISQYYAGDTTIDTGDIQAYGVGALVGIVVATFLAFLIGGYAAGRISLWNGVKHGALIVVWPILFAILGIALGAVLGGEIIQAISMSFGVTSIDQITGGAIIGIVATLVAMLAGGALGGRLGERYHERSYGAERRRTYARGRTF